ncbi:MAG: hypothetical protein ABSE42_04005 [Bryobacteraceae bacterium]|jgi:hypothetical protein
MRIHLAILRTAACLVPGEQRAEWLAEWRAELWYLRQRGDRQITVFCLGSFRDALWLRRNSPPDTQPWLHLETPAQCIGFLCVAAAVCVLFALRYHPPDCPMVPIGPPLLFMLWMAVTSLPALLATTSLRMGEYPANRYGWRWVFFLSKIGLVLSIVFCGGLALWPIIGPMVGNCMLIGCVIALRWALIDQRQRCPECLRLLGHPARIGHHSHTFLDSCGTEFVCPKGHGLLYVPETSTISFRRTQRWQHLDRSWSGLFS